MSEIFKKYKYIYDSRKHLLEMLEDRGYNVDHLKNYTSDEIKTMLQEQYVGKFNMIADIGPLDIFLEKKVNSNVEKIYVKYRLDSKFKGTANVKEQIKSVRIIKMPFYVVPPLLELDQVFIRKL